MFDIGGAITMRVFLTIVYLLVCIALTVIVLAQEGKDAGLGAIGGIGDSYWGKNKSRSMEGRLVKFTTLLAVLFILLAVILNLNF
jgi:preprotein translocase subunit SecG